MGQPFKKHPPHRHRLNAFPWMMRGKEKEIVETRFTPGPWIARKSTNGNSYHVFPTNDPLLVIAATQLYPVAPHCDNANLIAAAPDLYAALEMVRDADDDCERDELLRIPRLARAKIDAALARARGES
jgi:hypothetical protein